jgi:magnesium transporter
MAVGEVMIQDWWRVLLREILFGFALGSLLEALCFLRIGLRSVIFDHYGPPWFWIALTVTF